MELLKQVGYFIISFYLGVSGIILLWLAIFGGKISIELNNPFLKAGD